MKISKKDMKWFWEWFVCFFRDALKFLHTNKTSYGYTLTHPHIFGSYFIFCFVFFFWFFHFTHFALAVLFIFKLSTSDISELSRSPVIIFPVTAGCCCCCCCCGGCCCCGCCCRCTCCSEFCCCRVSPGLLLV